MGFKRMTNDGYPPRQWAIVGYPGVGKSTFVAQMRQPVLTIDADHRFSEIARLNREKVFYEFGDNPEDNADPRTIAKLLDRDMPGSDVATIVVDSLTSIIAPLVGEAIQANDAGENKNRIAAFKPKAMAMQTLQDAITRWGRDTVWIYHLRERRDANANMTVATSISAVELARLRRSLNMVIRLVDQGQQRVAIVDWCREGRDNISIADTSGCWAGIPEAIESAVYDNLTDEEKDEKAKGVPKRFADMNAAIAWGFEQGVFSDAVHAQNAYNKVKEAGKPATAQAMWDLWIAEVLRRVAEQSEKVEV